MKTNLLEFHISSQIIDSFNSDTIFDYKMDQIIYYSLEYFSLQDNMPFLDLFNPKNKQQQMPRQHILMTQKAQIHEIIIKNLEKLDNQNKNLIEAVSTIKNTFFDIVNSSNSFHDNSFITTIANILSSSFTKIHQFCINIQNDLEKKLLIYNPAITKLRKQYQNQISLLQHYTKKVDSMKETKQQKQRLWRNIQKKRKVEQEYIPLCNLLLRNYDTFHLQSKSYLKNTSQQLLLKFVEQSLDNSTRLKQVIFTQRQSLRNNKRKFSIASSVISDISEDFDDRLSQYSFDNDQDQLKSQTQSPKRNSYQKDNSKKRWTNYVFQNKENQNQKLRSNQNVNIVPRITNKKLTKKLSKKKTRMLSNEKFPAKKDRKSNKKLTFKHFSFDAIEELKNIIQTYRDYQVKDKEIQSIQAQFQKLQNYFQQKKTKKSFCKIQNIFSGIDISEKKQKYSHKMNQQDNYQKASYYPQEKQIELSGKKAHYNLQTQNDEKFIQNGKRNTLQMSDDNGYQKSKSVYQSKPVTHKNNIKPSDYLNQKINQIKNQKKQNSLYFSHKKELFPQSNEMIGQSFKPKSKSINSENMCVNKLNGQRKEKCPNQQEKKRIIQHLFAFPKSNSMENQCLNDVSPYRYYDDGCLHKKGDKIQHAHSVSYLTIGQHDLKNQHSKILTTSRPNQNNCTSNKLSSNKKKVSFDFFQKQVNNFFSNNSKKV